MNWKKDIIMIIKDVFNVIFEEQTIEDMLEMDMLNTKSDRLLFLSHNLDIDISIFENNIILESIIISEMYQNKGFATRLMIELINYSNNKKYDSFEVKNIISSRLNNICNNLKMEHIESYFYGQIHNEYNFDGFFGNRKIKKQA